jgi:hypothetical protein
MLSNSALYRIWRERLSQLIPEGCKYHRYRLTNNHNLPRVYSRRIGRIDRLLNLTGQSATVFSVDILHTCGKCGHQS